MTLWCGRWRRGCRAGDFAALFALRGPHLVPQRYLAMLDACG